MHLIKLKSLLNVFYKKKKKWVFLISKVNYQMEQLFRLDFFFSTTIFSLKNNPVKHINFPLEYLEYAL